MEGEAVPSRLVSIETGPFDTAPYIPRPCLLRRTGFVPNAERHSRNNQQRPRTYALDKTPTEWDYPTMTVTADTKKRVIIGRAHPGDVFDVQEQGEGRFLLVRLEKPKPKRSLSEAACQKAIEATPLHFRLTWDELRQLTREP